ncbi:sodium:solute symporter (plasmid) [Deltaproteobacteria bacterium Smac51]|nr:sodium:solute symporter [Deltaproteobacteria bacterium Smac51]
MILVVLIVYFLLMLGVGIWANRFNNDVDDFLLAGRRLGIVFASFALAATYFGGGFVIGIGQMAYEKGLVAWWNGIAGGLGLILVALVACRMRDMALYTVPDFLSKRFGSTGLATVASVLSLVALVGILAGQVSAARNVFAALGMDPVIGGFVAAVIFVVYTSIGGLWAATLTDFIQMIIAGIGCVAAALIVINNTGGWEATQAMIDQVGTPENFYGMMGGDGFSFILWLTLPLILYTFIGQDVYQRIFASKDGRTARNSCILAGVIIIGITIFPALMGMSARGMFPDLPDTGMAVPTLIMSALSPVVAGLVLAAIMAAIMSTAASILTAATSHVINDVYREVLHKGKELDPKRLLMLSRVWTLIIGVLAIGLSFLVPQIVKLLLMSYTLYTSGVFIPVVGGFFWKKATRQGAVAAMATGTVIAVAAIGGVSFFGIPTEIFSGLVCLVVFTAVSLATQPAGQAQA